MDFSSISGALPDLGPITQGLQFEPLAGSSGVFQLSSAGNRQSVTFYTKEFYHDGDTQAARLAAEANGEPPPAPVYHRREMVRIVTPGDRSVYDGVAEEYHKRNYFRQYAAYRDGKNGPIGTDLKDAEFVGSSELIELNYLGCYTIEQLADAADSLCDRLPRGYELRNAAKVFLEVTNRNSLLGATKKLSGDLDASKALILKLERDLTSQKKEADEMKAILARMSLNAQVEDAEAETPRRKIRLADKPGKGTEEV